jgi:hypothetical protein
MSALCSLFQGAKMRHAGLRLPFVRSGQEPLQADDLNHGYGGTVPPGPPGLQRGR